MLSLSSHSLPFFGLLGVFVLLSFPHPFVLCCPPHALLWSFCCPATLVLFTLLSGWGCGCPPPQQQFLPTKLFGAMQVYFWLVSLFLALVVDVKELSSPLS